MRTMQAIEARNIFTAVDVLFMHRTDFEQY